LTKSEEEDEKLDLRGKKKKGKVCIVLPYFFILITVLPMIVYHMFHVYRNIKSTQNMRRILT